MKPGIVEGLRLFNERRYFEAHEALEAVWLKAQGSQKTFVHGLIQVAAAFHHHQRGNRAGFRSLLEKGCAKLERNEAEVDGLDLAGFMAQLRPWRELLDRPFHHGPQVPPLIRIKPIKDTSHVNRER